MEITDEMVFRAAHRGSFPQCFESFESMPTQARTHYRDILDAAINPPPDFEPYIAVTSEMTDAAIKAWHAVCDGKTASGDPAPVTAKIFAETYRAMRRLDQSALPMKRFYAICDDLMRVEPCRLGDKCCIFGTTYYKTVRTYRRASDPK